MESGFFHRPRVQLSSNFCKATLYSGFSFTIFCAALRRSLSTHLVIICVTSGMTHFISLRYTSEFCGTSFLKGASRSWRNPVFLSTSVGKNFSDPTYKTKSDGYRFDASLSIASMRRYRKGLSPEHVTTAPCVLNSFVCMYSHPVSCFPAISGPKFCSSTNLLSFPRKAKQNDFIKYLLEEFGCEYLTKLFRLCTFKWISIHTMNWVVELRN